jgi:hypothetical protein
LLQDGHIEVSVFPECEEILIGVTGFGRAEASGLCYLKLVSQEKDAEQQRAAGIADAGLVGKETRQKAQRDTRD